MKKILVALSGGVDSAVAAALLQQQGYHVAGAYVKTWMNDDDFLAECPAEEDILNAQAVAQYLNIDFNIVSLVKEYRERVVHYLVEGYRRGVTPNPDIMCNREMKFGILRDYAFQQGFHGIATGHYCQIFDADSTAPQLKQGIDPNKDQSYFLAMVRPQQFQHAYFPIGSYQKPQVRQLAQELGLPNANRKDSQGICFLGKVNINQFLAEYIPERPGDIINHHGKVVGQHKGLHHFTIGQRRGIGVPSNTDNEAYVVVAKDLTSNSLHVAFDQPNSPHLYSQEVILNELNIIDQRLLQTKRIDAKPRYRDPCFPASIAVDPDALTATIRFDEPQRALALGQVLAIYQDDQLLGGGVYQHIHSLTA